MDKVYIVTTGTYSEYGIDSVFDTEEEAEDHRNTFPSSYKATIAEYFLNKKNQIKRKSFKVSIFDNGFIAPRVETNQLPLKECWEGFTEEHIPNQGWEKKFIVNVCADDEQHAVKIAAEKRAFALAQKENLV